MRRRTLLATWLTVGMVLAILAGCGRGRPPAPTPAAPPDEILVSAAASLADALKEIQVGFAAAQPNIRLLINIASTGALQQQIERGAPVDVFIAAAPAPMDALVQKGRVARADVQPLATNKVVLVRSPGAKWLKSWADLKSDQLLRVAMGNPQHVPAGQYGQEVLEKLGLWPAMNAKVVLGGDVRQVLSYVELGEADAGIVYRTDAALARRVTVVAEAPAGTHAPVVYPVAVVKDTRHPQAARALVDYLLSAAGRDVLRKYGFGAIN